MAAICLLALVISLALSILQMSINQMTQQREALYDQMEVQCAVTNLTGTQTDNLSLPSWVVDLFFSDVTTVAGQPQDRAFSSYVRDVCVKKTITTQSKRALSGVSSLAADPKMRADNGCKIIWLDGYDAGIFTGESFVCLIPEELYSFCPTDDNGNPYLHLGFESRLQDKRLDHDFIVAGYYTGDGKAVYCPWLVMRELCQALDGYVSADSIRATVRNNREIEPFRDYAAGWFATVTASGDPQPWDASPLYDSYPFAFEIYDSTFQQTLQTLQDNISLMRLASRAILALSLAIGFLAGFLLIRNRARELALMQTLGTGKTVIFFQALLEQAAPTALGVVLASAGFAAAATPPLAQLAAFFCFDIGGAAAATALFLRQNLLSAMKEENE